MAPGQVLVRIDGEDSETEIFTAQQNLESAQEELEAAQKNLDNCNAVAPISGHGYRPDHHSRGRNFRQTAPL
ncbi:MAG: hypothetical protein ACLSHO_05660 [Dysosmobacter sp.]